MGWSRHARTARIPVVMLCAVVVGFFLAVPAVAASSCDGFAATIEGTPDAEVIDGTSGDDVIAAKESRWVVSTPAAK